MLTWQVLIASIPHRHERLLRLLAELDEQMMPEVGVLLYRDNLEKSVAVKRQVLLEAATAWYVSFIDDDDMVPSWFVHRAMAALSLKPEYVGFPVEYYVDGEFQALSEHSLRYGGYHAWTDRYVRDITHLNPIRRELAVLGRFDKKDGIDDHGCGEDGRWADQVRATGRVRDEEWIPETMYRYYFNTSNCHRTLRSPMPPEHIQPLPSYWWLRVIGEDG